MRHERMNKNAVIAIAWSAMMVWPMAASAAENMPDMPGMDHSSMNQEEATPAMSGDMSGMNHLGHGDMGAAAAPADPRDPHAYSGGYDFGPIAPPKMADQAYMGGLMVNQLEAVRSRHNTFNMIDLQGWFGKDYDRLVVKAEGEVDDGKLHEARTELLWSHAVAAYWNGQIGVRHDSGMEPDQDWLALSVQGLAPYWFEVDVAFYMGEQGRTAARVAAEYELLITQKLVLQPSIEVNIYGKSDPIREIGSGLSDAQVGLRLRYEFTRQFAPYIGLEWAGKVGKTADFGRSVGGKTSEMRRVAGVRFWF